MAPLAERFVRVRGDVRPFERDLRDGTARAAKVAGARAGSDWAKAFQRTAGAQLAKMNLRVKVTPDFEALSRLPNQKPIKVPMVPDDEKLKRAPKVPKVPVELDPLTRAFQAEVRRQINALARQAAKIPVNADTSGLREDIADKLRTVERFTKVKVEVGAEARGFDLELRRLAREVESQVRVHLPVDADTDKVNQFRGALTGLASGVNRVGLDVLSNSMRGFTNAAGNAGTGVTNLTTNIFNWIPALAIGAAVLTTLPAALGAATAGIYALGGAIASLPALGAGLGASVGVLGLGFAGLADRFKKTAGGGGAAAKSLSGLRSATYAVTQAQRELTKSTLALNRARAEEVERIDDLGRALRGAELDEEDALAGVAAARAALAAAQGTGDPNEIGRATRELKRANLTLEEARDKTGDLAAEKAKADKAGVEGSDAVQEALERQRDATERLELAQLALVDAQKSAGGGGGAAQDLLKIAPAAQQVVDELKALKPAFDSLRLDVQQRLFVGVADELQKLADTWLPRLKESLGSYADTFNGLFKRLSATVREPRFIANVQRGLEDVRRLIERVGNAIVGPLTDAFGRLAGAAGPFLEAVGDEIVGIVEGFSNWVKSADESGALTKFMQDAAKYLHDIFDIGGLALKVVGQFLGILFSSKTKGGGDSILENIKHRLEDISAWLGKPENQQKVRDFIDAIGELIVKAVEFVDWLMREAIPTVERWMTRIDGWVSKVDGWAETFKSIKDKISGPFKAIGDAAFGAVGSVGSAVGSIVSVVNSIRNRISFGGMFNGLREAFRSAINGAIDIWNRLSFPLPSTTWFGVTVGGGRINVPRISHLADGGIVKARPGGTRAIVGEGGEDEAVAPLSKLADMIRDAVSGAAGGGDIVIPVYLGTQLVDTVVVSALGRKPEDVARAANRGNKRLGFAGT